MRARSLTAALTLALGFVSALSAQSTKFQAERGRLHQEAAAARRRLIQIDPRVNGAAQATVLCGKNFYNGVLQMTGTMAQVK
jgi:hypothetical protein